MLATQVSVLSRLLKNFCSISIKDFCDDVVTLSTTGMYSTLHDYVFMGKTSVMKRFGLKETRLKTMRTIAPEILAVLLKR